MCESGSLTRVIHLVSLVTVARVSDLLTTVCEAIDKGTIAER